MTKTKAPPKKTAGEVSALFKGSKLVPSTGYLKQLTSLLAFLGATDSIRTSAEIVQEGLNISDDGTLIAPEQARAYFISHKLSGMSFLVKEENDAYGKLNGFHKELSELSKIIVSKAKANTDEKKEKAKKKADELRVLKDEAQAELNEVRSQQNQLKADALKELEATEFSIEEIREQQDLMVGAKIKITLETGCYTFPIPVGTGYYREVCNMLGLPIETLKIEKPVIKKMFTFPPEVLDAIKKAMLFVSNDDLRPSMTCVLLEIWNNKMVVVATDAHRLFRSRTFTIEGPPIKQDYLLPAKAMKRLPKTIKEDFKFYEMKAEKAAFLGIEVETLDVRFPDWKVVFPEYKNSLTFKKEDFVSCVKQAKVFSNKSTSQVNIAINGDMKFLSQDVDFGFESGIRMNYIKKDMEDKVIGFNGQFLIDSMTIFKTNEVTMLHEGASSKCGIFTDGVDHVLLMPLMLNDNY